MLDGLQVQRLQWTKITSFICSPLCLVKILKSKRTCRALAKLLPLLETGDKYIPYSTMAKLLGYKTRAGAYKATKLLFDYGILERTENGDVHLTMKGIIIDK